MSFLHRRRPHVVSNPGPDSLPPATQTVSALYTIERHMGFSVQTNLLTVWIAATTYLTAALGIVALLFGSEFGKALDENTKVLFLSMLPLPACALAGYHLIFFGIGLIHSDSIQVLERELVKSTTRVVQEEYECAKIGSKGETAWTDFKSASTAMRITSGVAFLVPYLAALLLAGYCLYRIYSIDIFAPWPVKCVVALYAAVLATILYFGGMIIFIGPKPTRKAMKLAKSPGS
jgi:hypothetical protein